MDVGSELRQSREQRGLSLRHLSDLTKINLSTLRAIEENDLARLPGGVFTRGFLKAYAREVGLDPIDIVRRYTAQFEKSVDASASGVDRPSTADASAPHDNLESVTAPRFERVRAVRAIAAAFAVASVCAFAFFSLWHSGRPASRIESARAGEVVVAADHSSAQKVSGARPETATTGSSDSNGPMARESDTVLRLALQPRGLCWVSATADGRQVVYRLMHAGERQTVDAHDELVLRVGDPASVDFSINGSSGRPLGRAGEATTIRITPGNYRDFLNR